MQKILFLYDHEYPHLWRDGLYAALQLLRNDFEVEFFNLKDKRKELRFEGVDFVLGWGGFDSPVDVTVRQFSDMPKGLCIGGNAIEPYDTDEYDVLFYETDWYYPHISDHKNAHKAFGVNTNIYFTKKAEKLFDVITVGAFSAWKRQLQILKYEGAKVAVGQIQRGNLGESMGIVNALLERGVAVSDMVDPETLAALYRSSDLCYIPADINGGGERAVLEAMACGVPVEVHYDNPKLQELAALETVPSHHDYYEALLKGIKTVI